MKYSFFHVPALDSGAHAEALNAFIAQTRVVQVQREFVSDGAASFWALCVTTAEGPEPLPAELKKGARGGARGGKNEGGNEGRREGKVDYKTVLNEADFRLFAALRDLRKKLAEQEGVPLYAVLTNEQMAEVARQRCSSGAELAQIEGVGPARVARYGETVLACVAANGETA
jgi:superfamily II DNA helicase RecQ